MHMEHVKTVGLLKSDSSVQLCKTSTVVQPYTLLKQVYRFAYSLYLQTLFSAVVSCCVGRGLLLILVTFYSFSSYPEPYINKFIDKLMLITLRQRIVQTSK